MDYYELRKAIAKVIPRQTTLTDSRHAVHAVKEKGRKSCYKEFKLPQRKWVKQERLLNTEEINSFVEVSCRAAACPMPLNLDVWDATRCPYNCIYCCPAGTQILMVDGSSKSIERIRPGDRVMSFNETTKRMEVATVENVMSRPYKKELICIETEDGHVIKVTPEHPIYTQRGWIDAKDLTCEDKVRIW